MTPTVKFFDLVDLYRVTFIVLPSFTLIIPSIDLGLGEVLFISKIIIIYKT